MLLGRGDVLYELEIKRMILTNIEGPSGQNCQLSLMYTWMSLISFHDFAEGYFVYWFLISYLTSIQHDDELHT